MGSFWADHEREQQRYAEGERLDEVERAMLEEASDWAVNGEDAVLIPESEVRQDDE